MEKLVKAMQKSGGKKKGRKMRDRNNGGERERESRGLCKGERDRGGEMAGGEEGGREEKRLICTY